MADIIHLDPIAAIFGERGALANAFPGYAPREGQIALARGVHDVCISGGQLVAEGPTGTGKSLAYLAPAVHNALRNGERIVVATANIALQEQLFGKDLPALHKAMAPMLGASAGWKFSLLKGGQNYACLHLINNPDEVADREGSLSRAELEQLASVDRWAATTETGDKSELPFVVSEGVWGLRSMNREECHGKACEFYDACFGRRAHDRAADATVVVTNFHLLFAHIALLSETDGRVAILPKHHALIMDEAHEAGDIARDFFGHTISEGRVKRVVKWCRNARAEALKAGVECPAEEAVELSKAADDIEEKSSVFFAEMESAMRPVLARKVNTLRSDQPACASVLAKLDALGESLSIARRLSSRIFNRVKRMGELHGRDVPREALRVQRSAEKAGRVCVKALSWITDATEDVERKADDADAPRALDSIHWIAAEEKENKRTGQKSTRFTWESRHVDLAPVLRVHVWDHIRTVVACSATMTTGRGASGWAWIKRQLGAPQEARTLSVQSPFDFARVALLCLPADAPDPTMKTGDREAFDRYVTRVTEKVARAAGGRTLGLFTSTRMARAVGEHLRSAVNNSVDAFADVQILTQGDAPRTQLVQSFKADETACLMGTASLWTGVDVPGHSLVAVVIDKLPFAPPGDPVMDAICERAVARTGREMAGFMEESLPRAVLALRQGAGRLIRSTSDFGVVVLCDPRLTTKGYGAEILRSLGMPTRTRSVEAAGAWIAREMERRGVGMESGRRAVGT